ncbi:Smr/MutS family protein [Psittacicella gerlachiana]|uniref:Smr domain-containing protein n=1 Tax=Psittacicella gerlachiana TaxID=2028574 RepID=A0A3A1YBF1_9GAMM|nr:Smr/MutS family protein [Psittacicella gerlachiana]RIY35462.1 hypothetical protein CKF59_03630 [Psittacicella gerlachiana]
MSLKDAIKRAFLSLSGEENEKDLAEFERLEEVKQKLAQAIDTEPQENIFDDHAIDLAQEQMQNTLHSLFDDSGKDVEANKGKSIYNTGEFKVLDAPAVYQEVEFDEQAYTDERGKVLGNMSFAEQANHAAPDYNPNAILGNTPRQLRAKPVTSSATNTLVPRDVTTTQNEVNETESRVAELKGNPQGIVHSVVKKSSHTRTITHVQRADGTIEQQIEDKNIQEDTETKVLSNGNLQETTNTSTAVKTTVHQTKESFLLPQQPAVKNVLSAPKEEKAQNPESFAALFEANVYDFSPEALALPANRETSTHGGSFSSQEKEKLRQLKKEVETESESFADLIEANMEYLPSATKQEQELSRQRKQAKMFAPKSYAKKVADKEFVADDEEEELAFNLDLNNASYQKQQESKGKSSFAQMFEAQPQNLQRNFVSKDDSFRKEFRDIKPLQNKAHSASLAQQRKQAQTLRRSQVGIKSGKELMEQQIAQMDYHDLSKRDDVVFSDINMRFNEFNYENARFAAPELDQEVTHAFFNGLLPIDREVDLHGCTSQDLKSIIPAVVKDCWKTNEFTIRFITGHGKDILKQNLPNYLVQYERIAAFYPNKENNGRGRTNGFIVLLRNYDKEVAASYSFREKKSH